MADQSERALHLFVLPEIVGFAVLLLVLSADLLGYSRTFASFSRPVLVGAWLVVAVELLIPLYVFLDLRRRDDDPDPLWVHAAAMPVVNLLGVVAYLEDRKRARADTAADDLER